MAKANSPVQLLEGACRGYHFEDVNDRGDQLIRDLLGLVVLLHLLLKVQEQVQLSDTVSLELSRDIFEQLFP